jgi:putative inorganic carbon (hco3(-)) transporter
MAFFALSIFTFIMFFQPTYVFPALEPYRPYRVAAIMAIILYLITGKKSKSSFFSINNALYFTLFVFFQLLSAATLWLTGVLDLVQNIWFNFVIIYFLIVKICIDEKKVKIIFLMIVSAITYLSYYSLHTIYLNYGVSDNYAAGFGWYENRNDLVYILTVMIPLIFCLAEVAKNVIIKYLFIFIAALFTANILFAGSRNGLLGLLTVGILSLIFLKKISRLFRLSLVIFLLISVLGIGLATVLTRSDLAGGLTGDDSSEDRLKQWKACLHMVIDHPFLGVGPNESKYYMGDYGGVQGLVPHNTLVQAFAETGIPGGVFFSLFMLYPIYQGWEYFKKGHLKNSEESIIIYKYLIISLCGFWVCAFFSNRLYMISGYVLIALITAVRENILKNESTFLDRSE